MGNCFLNPGLFLFLYCTWARKQVNIKVEKSEHSAGPWPVTFRLCFVRSSDGKVVSCTVDPEQYYLRVATFPFAYPFAEHNSHGTRPILVMKLSGKPIMVYNEPYFGESPYLRLQFPLVYFGDRKEPSINCLDKMVMGFPNRVVLLRDFYMIYELHDEYLWKGTEQEVGNRPHELTSYEKKPKKRISSLTKRVSFINIEAAIDQANGNPIHCILHTSNGLTLETSASENRFDLKTKQTLVLREDPGNPKTAVIEIEGKDTVIMVYSPVHLGEGHSTTLRLEGHELHVNGNQGVIDLARLGPKRWPPKQPLVVDYVTIYGQDTTYVKALAASAAKK